ncbi:hypothetical protein [Sphingomonas oligoaromativorans]|uniref:hypothetical protein n=1 Tax=Sphingomonas oligoaromativorans TaxID=575322 RepID=UPI00141FB494|nr:hypothetical protein [Sphingomonas oligoaromativorans]
MPERDPSAFGAGIGEGVSAIGGAIQHVATAADSTRYALGDAARQQQMGAVFRQQQADQTQKDPSGAGFADAIGEQFDKIYGGVDLPRDPELRQRAQVQLTQDRARWMEQAQGWEMNARATAMADNAGQAINLYANDLGQTAPTDTVGALAAFHATLQKIDTMVAGTAGLHPEAAIHLRRQGSQEASDQLVHGLIDRGALSTAREIVDGGGVNATVTPQKLNEFNARIDAEQRRLEAQQRAAIALGKSQAEQSIALVNSRLGDGVRVPEADLAQAATLAHTFGLEDKAYNLEVARQRQNINIESESWTPQQYQDEINRIAALGPKASEPEQVRLDQLRKIVGQRTTQFHDNPGAYAAANGAPPPTIDADSGHGFAERAQWRASVQRSTGAWTPTLSKEEAAPWIEKVQHGAPADRLATAQWINQWGGEAPNVLRQIDPNQDSAFSQAVKLGSVSTASMRDALAGPDALKALGGEGKAFHIDPLNSQQILSDGTKLTPDTLFGLGARSALSARGASFAAGVLENAKAIYASTAQKNGWDIFHPGEFQRSIQRAAGGREVGNGQWVGGFGTHNGQTILLPSNMSQQDFDRRLARATPDDLFRAGGHVGPAYGNGQSLTAGELKALTPVAVGSGRYIFRTGNAYVMAKRGEHGKVQPGQFYVLDMSQIPAG